MKRFTLPNEEVTDLLTIYNPTLAEGVGFGEVILINDHQMLVCDKGRHSVNLIKWKEWSNIVCFKSLRTSSTLLDPEIVYEH